MRLSRTRCAALAIASATVAAGAAAAVPGAAQAATVSQAGNVLVYTADSGEQNNLTLVSRGTAVVDFAESGRLQVRSTTSRCGPTGLPGDDGRSVRCGLGGIARIDVRLGDGGDSFRTFHSIPIVYEGGTGNDAYSAFDTRLGPFVDSPAAPSQVDYRGGAGTDIATYNGVSTGVVVAKDEQPFDGRIQFDRDNIRGDVEILQGTSRNDSLTGGAGAETFVSTGGSDTLGGRGGNDFFQMGSFRDGPTTVLGGEGRDKVSYRNRTFGVHVSPDTDSSPDGQRDEGDRVFETEIVEGGSGDDSLVTLTNAAGDYELYGFDGDDILASGNGSDRLEGGRGIDSMSSGAGRDGIVSRDGNNRERVNCGSGTDAVRLDLGDSITSCESRDNGIFVGELKLTPASSAISAGDSARLDLRWTHPVAWQRLKSVQIVLRDGGRERGRVTVRPRGARVDQRGALALVRGTRLSRRGGAVSVKLVARTASSAADRDLTIDVIATDVSGRRQVESEAARITVENAR